MSLDPNEDTEEDMEEALLEQKRKDSKWGEMIENE